LIFDEYRLVSGLAMEQAVKSVFSGDVETAALATGMYFKYSVRA